MKVKELSTWDAHCPRIKNNSYALLIVCCSACAMSALHCGTKFSILEP